MRLTIKFFTWALFSLLLGCGAGKSSKTFTIGGSIEGLSAGDQVVLINNGGDPLTLSANGKFAFKQPVNFNAQYSVTVRTQPQGKICTVGEGMGAGVVANVTSVVVTCSPVTVTHALSGTLTGLAKGQQVILKNNDADPLFVSADGRFSFATKIAHNSSYAVTVGAQPTGQTCTVSKGSGAGMVADVDSVAVTCATNTFKVGGTVTGLANDQQVTLFNNNADPVIVTANGKFAFAVPIAYQGSFSVTVGTQPIGQTCTVIGGSGAGMVADVDSVAVTCSTNTFKVGGTVTGLASNQQVTLFNNNADPVIVTADGKFTFAVPVAYRGNYSVTVGTQPIGQTCTVSNGGGAGMVADVDSIRVTCSGNTFKVGGTVTGLVSGQQVTLLNSGADALTVSVNGSFTFAAPVAFNGSYAVTVGTQPTGQVCSVSKGAGAGVVANVSSVEVICSTTTFKVGGTVKGLSTGQQVTLFNNNADPLTVSADGPFTFATPVPYNGSYAVMVSAQPTNQTCTVSNGSGAGTVANVNSVEVVCSANTVKVGGTVKGLVNDQQVTLKNNGADPLTVSADGSFTFPTPVVYNGSYAVTVDTQPTGLTCTVSNGTDTGVVADVASVVVTCSANTFKVGVTVSGLATGQQVTLKNNGADPLTISVNGSFTFPVPVAYNGGYAVTVDTQPTAQTCTVSNGVDTGVVADVTNVTVTCSASAYAVGGAVVGLANGQEVTLLNNGADSLRLSADGGFTFPTKVAQNGSFAITVDRQPIGQTCTVSNGVGTGVVADVTSVMVNCSANTYTVGGAVAGLSSGQQLTLLNNGADPLIVQANGSFTFATRVAHNGGYVVTVDRQPEGQTCTVSNGNGAGVVANVSAIAVTCSTNTFKVGGTVSGLASGQQVTLFNNNADPLIVQNDGSFTFDARIAFNGSYAVTVGTQPTGQTCSVSKGSGSGVVANVNSVEVTCSTNTFKVSGAVKGLVSGQQVTLKNNGADPLTVLVDGVFTFATPVAYNGSYAVTVDTQPTGQTCTVNNGSGAGMVANVSAVEVVCSANTFKLGGTVKGLAGGQQVTLLNNGADALIVSAIGNFTFPVQVAYNASYAVTVGTQPTGQTCTVSNGNGAGMVANVSSVEVVCSTNTFKVGGTVQGLATGRQVTLKNNAADPLTVSADGSFTFAAEVAYNGSYAVTVDTQPTGQTCTVNNGASAGVTAAVTSVEVVCSANMYQIGGTVAGLASGQQITLVLNGTDPKTVTDNGSFAFSTKVAYQGSYAVTIGTPPIGQTCSVSNGANTGVLADVDTIAVTCVTTTYPVTGAVSGLYSGAQLTLLYNGTQIQVGANGTINFPTEIPYNSDYAITVANAPVGQECKVINGSGTSVTQAITNVQINCARADIIYVANKNENTVSAFSLNSTTGDLAQIGVYATGTQPRNGTIDPAGRFLYIPNMGDGNFSMYSINADNGTLTFVKTIAPGGPLDRPWNIVFMPGNPAIAYTQSTVAYTDTTTFAVRVCTVDPATGELTATGKGANYPADAQWQTLVFDPLGKYVYGGASISSAYTIPLQKFTVNWSTGELTKVGTFTSGSYARHAHNLLFSGSKLFAYTIEDGGSVGKYSVDQSTGGLTFISRTANLLLNVTPVTTTMNPAKSLIFGGSSYNSGPAIYQTLSVDQTTGALTAASQVQNTGSGPFTYGGASAATAFGFNSTGKFAFIGDFNNNKLFKYAVDATGTLTDIGTVTTGNGPNGFVVLPAPVQATTSVGLIGG
ncbi:6-phosphogluconolactonase [Ralstonia chuxiongensis]|nr:6-phosphogluconolactonase [Ralstonia chuxiongensis]